MRTSCILVVALALLAASPKLALADAPSATAEAVAPAAVAATVLEHKELVVVDAGRRLTRTVTWTVRVDDPAACSAGLIAPNGLDGASNAGATVLEGVLILPSGAPRGSTFTLSATTRGDAGGQSGVFGSAPDLPVESAVLEVRAPAAAPLHVWFDPGGAPDFGTTGGRSVTVRWKGLPPRVGAQAVWSTWDDWIAPGEALSKRVDAAMGDKADMGRQLAADIDSLDVQSIVGRVYDAVPLDATGSRSWSDARPAAAVAKGGTGSAVDRGVLLINLLRLAGYEARPGRFRPPSAGGAFPVNVPAPELLPLPVVVVEDDEDGTFYIDPAADLAEIPDLPASMAGGTVWLPGDLPTPLRTSALVDGVVTINGNLTIAGDGSTSWTATISASGTASEWMRTLLAPLDATGRSELLGKLARAGRPKLDRFVATATGVERTDKQLKVTLSGHDDKLLAPLGNGLAGRVPPLIAPALAAWLPPNVRVHESLAVNVPSTVQVLAVDAPDSAYAEEALVSRTFATQGQRQTLVVEVERPYRSTTAALDASAKRFLDDQAKQGFELVLSGPADAVSAKSYASMDRPPSERATLEALLWLSVENTKKANKALSRPAAPLVDVVPVFARYVTPGDARPWQAVAGLATERMDDATLLAVAREMERDGLRREAWVLAAKVRESTDPSLRVAALLMTERLQDERPDPEVDPDGAALWRDPAELLAAAAEAAPDDPELATRKARAALAAGQSAQAEALLEQVLAATKDPRVEILLAEVGAGAGVAIEDVLERIRTAVARAPEDRGAVAAAATSLAALGQHVEASRYALTAARLAWTDPDLWSAAVDAAIAAGEAPIAAYAARRASDLDPGDVTRAKVLAFTAAVVDDEAAFDLGRERSKTHGTPRVWPQNIDRLLESGPEDALYAVLVFRDDQVVASPRLLALRAQLHIERGRLDDAARDGVLLTSRHGAPEGAAMTFAATAGRLYSSVADRALDRAAAADLTARLTRMEYRLITGTGDAAADAAAIDDPRASVIARLKSSPAALASGIEGWPAGLVTPKATPPRGFRPNKLLGAVPGVLAWSDPEGATAILRVGGITGLLPPPLANLYSASQTPLKSREDGAQVLRMDGGVMPLYVAQKVVGEQEILGVGFTPESAERALDAALR